nr:methyltransferase domain-containing protein [Pseudopedobacter sp.]
MEESNKKSHWDNIYKTKKLEDVSWYQQTPKTSLVFLKEFNIPKSAKIIDIGGGDSLLVDHLLKLDYTDITVLDISATSLERAKERLGDDALKVKWIVADIADFKPNEQYDFWHDRAAFHFLTAENEVDHYIQAAKQGIKADGVLVLGTFSESGPKKCSGIEIKQYSEVSMTHKLKSFFKKVKCINVNHETPFSTIQEFVFCSFRKLVV